MTNKTTELTNLHPDILKFQNDLRKRYATENKAVKPDQILFVGSSLMEIFPIARFQEEQQLGLDKVIYNRGIRATTTADLLAHMDTLIFDLQPSKIFMNIGTNDIGFNVPKEDYLNNYAEILDEIHARLPKTTVYLMAYYPINVTASFGEDHHEHRALYAHRSNALYAAASADVAQLAREHDAEFINVNAGLTDADGDLRTDLTFDGAHMLPQGFQIVLENMMPYLK
ncbi:GDSL-type esterase/lipase family protein [Furfurilactobacillus siliginis]|uniref:GDSL-like lipase acylhydrolase family protein n=1 Tax=Furfurilactobacillus siliginis TaxID=348151 RepID=A0A0R2L6J2_9LACO|nr:GDSL-type esterase/lipase family protein [Furfurilactobacillus siliginis]KRN97283.1 GDSL-like lipase acylhydrolase family protein [Furfurilactobacillus siliginis]GEK28594.1 lysophospholipase [Furfurilactobacillus siliginis]